MEEVTDFVDGPSLREETLETVARASVDHFFAKRPTNISYHG